MSLERTTIAATTPRPAGNAHLTIDVIYEGGPKEVGRSATVTMAVNGTKVAGGKLTRTIPAQI
jgi:arylsulfatase